eukprot:EG_transcript_17338
MKAPRVVALLVCIALTSLLALVTALTRTSPAPTLSPTPPVPAPRAGRDAAQPVAAVGATQPRSPRPLQPPAAPAPPGHAPSQPPSLPLAPDFVVVFNTTKGLMVMDVHRVWAPIGAQRFYDLVTSGFYDGVAFFRVIHYFMAQLGISGVPAKNYKWRAIKDDPVVASNTRGTVSYAKAGPNTRTTQIFFNFGNNKRLDGGGFSPFARLRNESLRVLDSIYSGYGESMPRGKGPTQGRIRSEGNKYLQQFPLLDWVLRAYVE